MSQSPDNKSIASTLRWTRWNALLMFSIILCGLIAWHYGANSAYYSSIEIELFRNFLLIEFPGVLLILYAIVVALTCRNQITTLPRCEYVVSLILYIPTILALFGIGFAIAIIKMQNEASRLDFLLPGIMFFGVFAWVVFTSLFILGNGYLFFGLSKARLGTKAEFESLLRSKTWRNSALFNTFSRIAILGLLFGGIILCDYFRLYWLEARYRYWVIHGQYEVLSIMEPHTLLLRNTKGSVFECDVEKKTMTQLSKAQLRKEYPQIAEEIANDSFRPIASTKLKDYGGQIRSAVSPDNHWSIHSDNQGISFFIASQKNSPRIPLYHGIWIAFHRFTPDGKYLITQGNVSHVLLSDVPIKLDRIIIWRVPDHADVIMNHHEGTKD